jgi:hypothetical protein
MEIFMASAINRKYGDNKRSEMDDKQMSDNRFIMIDMRTEFDFDRKIKQIKEVLRWVFANFAVLAKR